MNNDISTEERIDNYLLGRMTEAERSAFEQEIERNPDLREEYECQKEVAHAVQKVAMKEFLAQHAAQRKTEKANVIDLSDFFRRASEKLQVFFSSGQRVVWTFASVAAMVVAVVGGINYSSTIRSLEYNGMLAYTELGAPIARDGNQIDALLEQAYSHLGNNELDLALETIEKAKDMIDEANSTITKYEMRNEEAEYEQELIKIKSYEADWYEAIVLMKQGKIIKAKRLLKAISESGSPYSSQAKDIIEKVF